MNTDIVGRHTAAVLLGTKAFRYTVLYRQQQDASGLHLATHDEL